MAPSEPNQGLLTVTRVAEHPGDSPFHRPPSRRRPAKKPRPLRKQDLVKLTLKHNTEDATRLIIAPCQCRATTGPCLAASTWRAVAWERSRWLVSCTPTCGVRDRPTGPRATPGACPPVSGCPPPESWSTGPRSRSTPTGGCRLWTTMRSSWWTWILGVKKTGRLRRPPICSSRPRSVRLKGWRLSHRFLGWKIMERFTVRKYFFLIFFSPIIVT